MIQPPTGIDDAKLQAVIISGGLATRAGGINKSFMRLEDRPIIDHQLARLSPIFGGRVAVATDRPEDYQGREIEVIPIIQFTTTAAQRSSLRGLISALSPFPDRWCLLLACDMPWPDRQVLTPQIEFLKRNAQSGGDELRGLCLHDGKRFRPYHSLLHGSLGIEARAALEAPDLTEPRSTREWLADRSDISKIPATDLGVEKKTLKACIANHNYLK